MKIHLTSILIGSLLEHEVMMYSFYQPLELAFQAKLRFCNYEENTNQMTDKNRKIKDPNKRKLVARGLFSREPACTSHARKLKSQVPNPKNSAEDKKTSFRGKNHKYLNHRYLHMSYQACKQDKTKYRHKKTETCLHNRSTCIKILPH